MRPNWVRRFGRAIKTFYVKAYEENLTGLSGMVAYNLLLSLFPLALLALFIASRVLQSGELETSALRSARLQGHVRPVRRQAHLLPRLFREIGGRRSRAQLRNRSYRARRSHFDDARERPRGAAGDLRGRHRRRRRPQADLDGRHAVRARRADRAR